MSLLLARTAEAVYIRAGYDRERAFAQGRAVAEYVLAHLDECRRQFNTEDEFELARLLALAMLSPSSPRYAS